MFWKKKKMIDIRELQRRGIIRIPKKGSEVITDKEGFVHVSGSRRDSIVPVSTPQVSQSPSSSGFIDFFGNSPSQSSSSDSSSNQFSTEENGYSKREVDARIEQLDNKVYKLEQRIELLERKAGVNSNW